MTMNNFKKSCLSIICYCIASASTLLVAPASYAGFINGFEGTGLLDNVALGNAFRPPDTMGAVGTNQFLESTNGSYTVYNKYTGAVQQRISFGNFWSNAGQSASANGDQRILFDHYTNRWISIGFGASVSDINIAVSSTSDAMGPWKSDFLFGAPIYDQRQWQIGSVRQRNAISCK